MSTEQSAGDGKTFAGHLIKGNFDQIFHHDIPKVLNLGSKEAKALRDGWNKLSPTLQTGLVHASSIVDEIVKTANAIPADVVNNILSKFTDLKIESLTAWLAEAQGMITGVNAAIDQDAATSIANLQAYFTKYFGSSKLAGILSTGAQILTSIIAPDSIFAQIATYIETAYQVFVKPKP